MKESHEVRLASRLGLEWDGRESKSGRSCFCVFEWPLRSRGRPRESVS